MKRAAAASPDLKNEALLKNEAEDGAEPEEAGEEG
jgi:hypothetical protein